MAWLNYRLFPLVALIIILAFTWVQLLAQIVDKDRYKVPAPAPESIHITATQENKLLKVQHELDVVAGKIKDAQTRFQQLQLEATQIQNQFPALISQQTELQKKMEAVVEETYKAKGLDKAKYDFSRETYEFTARPVPAPAPAK
jgi:hypothetical protein